MATIFFFFFLLCARGRGAAARGGIGGGGGPIKKNWGKNKKNKKYSMQGVGGVAAGGV